MGIMIYSRELGFVLKCNANGEAGKENYANFGIGSNVVGNNGPVGKWRLKNRYFCLFNVNVLEKDTGLYYYEEICYVLCYVVKDRQY